MKLSGDGKLLRIFIGEDDHHHGKPLFEAIVLAARSSGLAGSTVVRGVESYGASSRIHTAKILRLSEDLPIVIEIVDTEEKIQSFLPMLDGMLEDADCGGLVTLERVEVIKYFHRKTP
jgi:uncharacterized protein